VIRIINDEGPVLGWEIQAPSGSVPTAIETWAAVTPVLVELQRCSEALTKRPPDLPHRVTEVTDALAGLQEVARRAATEPTSLPTTWRVDVRDEVTTCVVSLLQLLIDVPHINRGDSR
jgi:hypothetical protein